MKHITKLVIITAALASMWGCSSTGEDSASKGTSSAPSLSSYTDTAESSTQISVRHTPIEEKKKPSLPSEIRSIGDGRLSYSTSVLSMSVTFPYEFRFKAEDYQPPYGIYLQNDTGTATLLLEAVNDNTISYRDMKEYLQDKYPQAEIHITDKKDVTCKRTMTDSSGNSYIAMQKYRLVKGGYQLASLCCLPEEDKKYSSVFSEIHFG